LGCSNLGLGRGTTGWRGLGGEGEGEDGEKERVGRMGWGKGNKGGERKDLTSNRKFRNTQN